MDGWKLTCPVLSPNISVELKNHYAGILFLLYVIYLFIMVVNELFVNGLYVATLGF